MKILDVSVNWNDGNNLLNSPSLKVLVDCIPKGANFRYEITDGRFFFAESEGFVNYGVYNFLRGENLGGYGGREWDITLKNGERKSVRGPWSSCSSVMNRYFVHSKEVGITNEPHVFERGCTLYAGAITIKLILEALRRFVPNATLVAKVESKEFNSIKLIDLDEALALNPRNIYQEEVIALQYYIVLKDGRWKPSQAPDPTLSRVLDAADLAIDAIVKRLII